MKTFILGFKKKNHFYRFSGRIKTIYLPSEYFSESRRKKNGFEPVLTCVRATFSRTKKSAG
jgi:hypothetical protein